MNFKANMMHKIVPSGLHKINLAKIPAEIG